MERTGIYPALRLHTVEDSRRDDWGDDLGLALRRAAEIEHEAIENALLDEQYEEEGEKPGDVVVTKRGAQLMRQVSALGVWETGPSTLEHNPLLPFEDMTVDAVALDMRDMFTVCSDHTAELGEGLDAVQYQSCLGSDAMYCPPCTRHRSDLDVARFPISTSSVDFEARVIPIRNSESNRWSSDDASPVSDHRSEISSPLHAVTVPATCRRATEISRDGSLQGRQDGFNQLLMEAALACRDGTAWCSKNLAQEALETSYSHFSRGSRS